MSKPSNDRRVYYEKRSHLWVMERKGAHKAWGRYNSRQEAEQAGRHRLRETGGGTLIIEGMDGQVKTKELIRPQGR